MAVLTNVTGKSAVLAVTTTPTDIVTNAASSGKILKINSIIVTNIDGLVAADITASLFRGGVEYKVASTISIPPDATLVVISKDVMLYLEEGDTVRLTASANGDLHALCSYEEIS